MLMVLELRSILVFAIVFSRAGGAWINQSINQLKATRHNNKTFGSRHTETHGRDLPVSAAALGPANHIQESESLAPFLQRDNVINWDDPAIVKLAGELKRESPVETAKACFEWVRDKIQHSYDYKRNPITCEASQVLREGTGFCYAKSHLLAALLRANGLPAGFCYQRLSFDDEGAPYCLHGLNAVHLPEYGWYRIDPRGNNGSVDAQFTPPVERLAFTPQLEEERDFDSILAEPLDVVVKALNRYNTWKDLSENLPDETGGF